MIEYNLLLEEIRKTETCKKINSEELKELKYKFYRDSIVWEIKTEIATIHKSLDVTFFLNFPIDFPFNVPKIFISKESYKELKYIPHISQDYSICIFDEGLNLILPNNNFSDFVELILARAKRIIRDAENIEYRKNEFKREFKAYWELSYSENDLISNQVFHSISNENDELVGLKFTNNYLGNYRYFISNSDLDIKKIKDYAKECKCLVEEIGIIKIDGNFSEPPFELTFEASIEIIKSDEEKYRQFQNLCNNFKFDSILIVFANNYNSITEYFGWTYQNVQILARKKGGSRHIISKIQHLTNSIYAKKNVTRLSFDNMNLSRLQIRTAGYEENQKSVAITGLGSVGSNLVFFLKNLSINKFYLIDKEILSSENINRHLLGFSAVWNNKIEGIKKEIKNSNPLIDVQIRNESVTTIIENEIGFINTCDFHFVAIGKTMIEKFILKNVVEGKLTKPVFLFWVEPFLASGQMLFIMPDDAAKAIELIQTENYPFGTLLALKNQSEKTYLIEGSCQTGYSPYSSSYLIQFLSAIFPYVKDHLNGKNVTSKVYSWIGDKELLAEKELLITDFAIQYNSFQLIIKSL
ncbi:ThiF family adenylyltransferase [Flavobacterium sp. N502536]|uniref:ThiF family adenylyltransferase n=1 Tax=Flavobacterium sp. N502536 TaxID=2986837 RepID=UPI0022231747|nr:ThiF family adenylyltransferase [Flavobacterium sp. N502536]